MYEKQKLYVINGRKNRIDLEPLIRIKPNHIYTITFNSDPFPRNLYTRKASIPGTPVELAPGIQISFPQDRLYVRSLISQLYFKLDFKYAQD